jgi:WD40 repeat protein
MLFRCNIMAIVSLSDEGKVMIWDDHKNKVIGELLFPREGEVKAVKLRKDLVVVALLHKIYVYNFSDLKMLEGEAGIINTVENKNGVCALSPANDNSVLACPDTVKGGVRIENYGKRTPTLRFQAHETELVAMSLNFDGTLLATASEKGTLIRVFNTVNGTPLYELRRGSDRALIHSIAFDQSNKFLACSSDKGTVHVFSLDGSFAGTSEESSSSSGPGESRPEIKSGSALGFMSGLIPKYFSSVWSFAQVISKKNSLCLNIHYL